MLPPTSRLPPIAKISSCSADEIRSALSFLRLVYCPEVRGSRARTTDRLHYNTRGHSRKPGVHGSNNSEIFSGSDDDLQRLRFDAFERSYAIKWLTTVISRVSVTESSPPLISREDIIQEAASLLAICAGTASAGTLTRMFTFPSSDGQCTIRAQLTDVPLDNHDFASVGSQTWGGACVLAEKLVRCPDDFGLVVRRECGRSDGREKIAELRVLELGAGTGLVSLILAKLLESPGDWTAQRTTIVATDFYPSVLTNLQNNIVSNFAEDGAGESKPSVSLMSRFLDWSKFSAATEEPKYPFDQPFDLILGADIVYEAGHAFWIKGCLTKLLRKPKADPGGIFHLVIPLRPTHSVESDTVHLVFPRQENIHTSKPHDRSVELGVLSYEVIVCDAHGDSSEDEVEYAYYQIGWC